MKYFLSFLVITSFFSFIKPNSACIFAQQSKTDSLELSIKTAADDSSKVKAINNLVAEKIRRRDYSQTDSLINIAIQTAQKINFKSGLGDSYKLIAFICENQNNFDEALKNHFISLKIRKEVGNREDIANTYRNIGNIYSKQGNYAKALEFLHLSLHICKEINFQDGIANTQNSIGNIYRKQGNNPGALENYFAALKIFERNNDKMSIAGTLNNIGNIYKTQNNYPEALKNYLKSLEIRKELNDNPGIAASFNNIGIIYFIQHDYSKAMENYMAALKIKEKLGSKREIAISMANVGLTYHYLNDYENALKYTSDAQKLYKETGDKNGVAEALINLAETNIKLQKYKIAQAYLDSALYLSKETGNINSLKECYYRKTFIDSQNKNFQSAFENLTKYIIYRDSLFNEENIKKMVEAEMNFNFEKAQAEEKLKQEHKDALQQQELYKQKIITYSLITGFILMLLLVITAYRNNKQKQRTNIELEAKNDLIEMQKIEVEYQKKLVDEKNQNITDSINYAKHIQASYLTSESYISQHLSDYFILYKPKDIVSGDFYWIMENNNDIYVCTADCTGHGIPGAFMSLIGIGILNEIIHSKSHLIHTDEILNELRRIIILAVNSDSTNYKGQDGMDAVLYRLKKDKMELEYSAANNPFYIIRANELLEFKPDKMPIGKYTGNEKPFKRTTIQLQKGDCIYTFSDGYTDQFGGESGKKFKSKQLKSLLISICQKSMPEQKVILDKVITSWKNNLEQIDDITMMGLRV